MAFVLLLLAGCNAKKNTELVVSVQSDVPVPKDLDAVKIQVLRAGVEIESREFPVGAGQQPLPGTLGVVSGGDPSQSVDVIVTGKFQSTTRVIRHVRTTFVKDAAVMLPIPLRFACFDTPDCGEGQTCVGGACKAIDVDPATLRAWDPARVFASPDATSNNGCFDPRVCMPLSSALTPMPGDPCTFAIPPTMDPTRVTLSLRTMGDSGAGYCAAGVCRVPLDAEANEGFTVLGATAHLADGLCQRLKAGAFAGIDATDACGQKTLDVPLCVGLPYPPAPYGTKVGNVFPPLKLNGYRSGSTDWTTIDVREFYSPTGTPWKGLDLDIAATWCEPCKAAAPNLTAQAATLAGKGIKLMEIITLDDNGGATQKTADAWIATYKLGLDVAIDPTLQTHDPQDTHYPWTYAIDATTMKITSAFQP